MRWEQAAEGFSRPCAPQPRASPPGGAAFARVPAPWAAQEQGTVTPRLGVPGQHVGAQDEGLAGTQTRAAAGARAGRRGCKKSEMGHKAKS